MFARCPLMNRSRPASRSPLRLCPSCRGFVNPSCPLAPQTCRLVATYLQRERQRTRDKERKGSATSAHVRRGQERAGTHASRALPPWLVVGRVLLAVRKH